jgi:hypothetical protein
VMRSEMMFDIGQKSGGFITGGLHHLAVQHRGSERVVLR